MKTTKLIIKHPLNLHLIDSQFKQLFELTDVTSLIKFHLEGIAVNSYGVNGNNFNCEEMRFQIREHFTDIPVIDIYEWENQ